MRLVLHLRIINRMTEMREMRSMVSRLYMYEEEMEKCHADGEIPGIHPMELVERAKQDEQLGVLISRVSRYRLCGKRASDTIENAVEGCLEDIVHSLIVVHDVMSDPDCCTGRTDIECLVEEYHMKKKMKENSEFHSERFMVKCEICKDNEDVVEGRDSNEEGLQIRFLDSWRDDYVGARMCCTSCYCLETRERNALEYPVEVCSVCHLCDVLTNDEGEDQEDTFLFRGRGGIISEFFGREHEEICYCGRCFERRFDEDYVNMVPWNRETLEAWKNGEFSVFDHEEDDREEIEIEKKKIEIKKKIQSMNDIIFEQKEKFTDGEYMEIVDGLHSVMKDLEGL